MGKFRSKLKGKNNGKRWPKGQSSNSNPTTQKYREMAKSRFFQENLGNSGLTQQAILKHDAMMTYGHTKDSKNQLSITKDLETMSLKTVDDGLETEYTGSLKSGTYKTFQTFASDWSQCSNVSFSKLLTRFDSNNAVHKEMLAVLAAVTEVIKEEGGKESSTAYFAALMQIIKNSEGDESLVAALSLLSMGIKSVPEAVLRKQFTECAKVFIELLEKNSQSDNGKLLRSVVGCLSVVLRAQEFAAWADSSTVNIFDSVLAFTLHCKPKVRKAAQHAVAAILLGSCFMVPTEEQSVKVPKVHPASNRVADFCLSQIRPEALLSGHKGVLQTLTMLRDVLPVFSKEYIKSTCEAILSLMLHNNVYIKTCSLHTLHALLAAPRGNLSGPLALRLVRALHAARPPPADAALGLAWAAVLQQAYTCLARIDLELCLPHLPAFVDVCVSELWLSDAADVTAAATNALKAVLVDCVRAAVASEAVLQRHRAHVDAVLASVGAGLDNPFNRAIRHVVLTIAVCFEIGNESIAESLAPLLKKLNERRESENFNNAKEAEYATGCAVRTLGPEFVLKTIPLRNGERINLDRSWLLPVLKEKITNSSLKFFATDILELATFCRKKSKELAEAKDTAGAHTYDLLCHQFWSLLPSFCNQPKDIKDNFKMVARVLGNVLKDNSEFRLSVMQALRKLIACSQDNEEDLKELGRFAKNYLPILLNIYMSPAKGSSAKGQRLAALETIQVYLTISEQPLREELYVNALEQLKTNKEDSYRRESVLDIIRALVLYQSAQNITRLFEEWVYPLSEKVMQPPNKQKRAKKDAMVVDEVKKEMRYKDMVKLHSMENKKAYRVLEEIFKSDKESCVEFVKENFSKIKKLLMSSLDKSGNENKAARLRCIEHLIKRMQHVNAESKLVKCAVAEAVVNAKALNAQCRQCAFSLVCAVGSALKTQQGGMKAYMELLLAGLDAQTPWLVACSLRLLASALYNFSEDMGLETVQDLLERVVGLMGSSDREITGAALSFLKVYTQVLPSDVLLGSLPVIIRSLSTMSEDCKRHHRLSVGYFLSRMSRKFGSQTVQKLVPDEDTTMLSRLRNIRKMDNRKKRMKDGRQESDDMNSEVDVKGVSKSLDDILKDSDSDMDYLEEEERPRAKAKTKKIKNQAWIQDDPENIVDLADVSSSRKITATKPMQKKSPEGQTQKKKDGGFKMAPDGRLIIADEAFDDDADDDGAHRSAGADDVDTDSDDTDEESTKENSKLLKTGTKRRYDDVLSVKSSRSAASAGSKYRAGGRGIHRPLGSAASVKSAGSQYKPKTAKGDVKRKGQPDPYAYLPLSRKNLNKRKKVITSKQFKGIVKTKAKGQKGRK